MHLLKTNFKITMIFILLQSPVFASDYIKIDCNIDHEELFISHYLNAEENGLEEEVKNLKEEGVIDADISPRDYLKREVKSYGNFVALKNKTVQVGVDFEDSIDRVTWTSTEVKFLRLLPGFTSGHKINRVTGEYAYVEFPTKKIWGASGRSFLTMSGTCEIQKVERLF